MKVHIGTWFGRLTGSEFLTVDVAASWLGATGPGCYYCYGIAGPSPIDREVFHTSKGDRLIFNFQNGEGR